MICSFTAVDPKIDGNFFMNLDNFFPHLFAAFNIFLPSPPQKNQSVSLL